MNPEIRQCHTQAQIEAATHEAVERLARGELIGLPTNQGYVAVRKAKIRFDSENLLSSNRWPEISFSEATPPTVVSPMLPRVLMLRAAEELADFVSPIPARGMRLLSRFPPGTVELVIITPVSAKQRHLSKETQNGDCIENCPERFFGCRVSSGDILTGVHAVFPWPLIASPLLLRGEFFANPLVESCCRLVDLLPKCLNYVIDTGEIKRHQMSAVIECRTEGTQIIQSHNMTESTIMQRSGPCILFVCTGNTCRSPMAEAICRKLLADGLQCTPAELSDRGIEVVSAGIAADFGSPASQDAVVLLGQEEVDLSDHRSQPLTRQLLDRADRVFAMTSQHRDVVLHHRPDLEDRTFVLGTQERDIPDPIGGGPEIYRQCKEAIVAGLQESLKKLIAEI